MRFFIVTLCVGVAIAASRHKRALPDGLIGLPWGEWSKCSEPCGPDGRMTRRQGCVDAKYGREIPDCRDIHASCNLVLCPNDPDYVTWEEWSDCSVPCGGGSRSRTGVSNSGQTVTEKMSCGMQSCGALDPYLECGISNLVFVLDSSQSLGELNWFKVKQFVIDTVASLNLGADQTHVGVVTYSTDVHEDIALDLHYDVDSLQAKIWKLPHLAGATNTGEALQAAANMLSNGKRADAKDMVFLLSDGKTNLVTDVVSKAATALKDSGASVYSIGVSELIDVDELKAISSGDSHFTKVDKFDDLQRIVDEIVAGACDITTSIECGEFGPWEECPVKCGGPAEQISKKICRKVDSTGAIIEDNIIITRTQLCGMEECPTTTTTTTTTTTSIEIKCEDWSKWSLCPITCGGPENQTRTRVCHTVDNLGKTLLTVTETDQQPCAEDPCPTTTTTTTTTTTVIMTQCEPWTKWSVCPITCDGPANETRTRSCKTATNLGQLIKTETETEWRPCAEDPCPTTTTTTTTTTTSISVKCEEWSKWSICPVTCGGSAVQTRTRDCHTVNNLGITLKTVAETDSQPCGEVSCPTPTPPPPPTVDCSTCDYGPYGVVAYLPHPAFCNYFFVCQRVPAGAPGHYSYIPHEMQCPGELYWMQTWMTCVPDFLSDNNACSFKDNSGTTTTTTTSAPPVCSLGVVPGKPDYFLNGETEMWCGANMKFDVDECTCVLASDTVQICDSDVLLYFPFDTDLNDHSCNKAFAQQTSYSDVILADDAVRGQVAYFDGASSLDIGFLYNYFAGQEVTSWSVALWYKWTGSTTDFSGLVNNGHCADPASFDVHVGGGLVSGASLRTNGPTIYTLFNDIQTVHSDWVHIALVYDGSQARIFMNGQEKESHAFSGAIENTQCAMNIGAVHPGSGYFEGYMDDIFIYDRSLTSTELGVLSRAPRT